MDLTTTESTLKEAQAILASEGRDLRSSLYRELLLNAIKSKRDELDLLDLKVLNRAMAEFRYAAKVFKPYRNIRKVSIFGSARTIPGSPYYELAVRFGRLLAERGYMVITGAASGIMRAGIEGAGVEKSFGVNILLPFEAELTGAIKDDPKLIRFRYFFTRKLFFVMEADAFALFPGGFGTQDEGFEVLTLLQTGKAPPMPLLLMDLPKENYWETWHKFIEEQLLKRGYLSPEDLSLYKIVHSPEEGVEWISFYYSTFHSLRQVGDTLVIRLTKPLGNGQIKDLNKSFPDLLQAGEITKTDALPPEEDEPELLSLPRVRFTNNKRNPARLNEMILAINRLGSER
jgi:uncharacterized protein (TIGR00730 family)